MEAAHPRAVGKLNDVLGQSYRKEREESLLKAVGCVVVVVAAAAAAAAPTLHPRPHPCPLHLQERLHSTPLHSLPASPPVGKLKKKGKVKIRRYL